MATRTEIRCVALSAIAGVLACIVLSGDHVRAQGARGPMGTLVVKVPRGVLPSPDYWLYVNGDMIGDPPASFASLASEFRHVDAGLPGSPRDEYWDSTGQAAVSERGHFTFMRSGLGARVFDSLPAMQKAPGRYVVELLTPAVTRPFPFAIARIEAQVVAGGTEVIEFGIPPGTAEILIARAVPMFVGTPEQTLEHIHNDLGGTVAAFDKSPVVAVLNEMLLSLSITPGRRPTVSAPLTAAMGGGRELDARQVSLMIAGLRYDYGVRSITGDARFTGAAPPTPDLAAVVAQRIDRHNAQIDKFERIVKALEQAKR